MGAEMTRGADRVNLYGSRDIQISGTYPPSSPNMFPSIRNIDGKMLNSQPRTGSQERPDGQSMY